MCPPQAGVYRLWYVPDSECSYECAETKLPTSGPDRGHRLVLQRWPAVAWIWIPGEENLHLKLIWFSGGFFKTLNVSSSSSSSSEPQHVDLLNQQWRCWAPVHSKPWGILQLHSGLDGLQARLLQYVIFLSGVSLILIKFFLHSQT